MIAVESARQHILDQISLLKTERIPTLLALERVLAEDIVSTRTLPPWDNSAMDGYALLSKDTGFATPEHPVKLDVVGEVPAGKIYAGVQKSGQAIRIMTGAPVPQGADAVIMQEETKREGNLVVISRSVLPQENIRPAGEDVKQGETVIHRGNIIKPAHIGMMASLGRSLVLVYQRPSVAILATGDELAEIDEWPEPGQITNSNGYALAAQVTSSGAIPILLGIARDSKEDLKDKLSAALRADVVMTSGGVSVGDFDFVKDVIADLGISMVFWKVAMKPGKPLAFGVISGKPVFGLPGNPVSSMVSFELFVRPALRKMMGDPSPFQPILRARLSKPLRGSPKRTHFVRVTLSATPDGHIAHLTGDQSSGVLKSMVACCGLAIIPPETEVQTVDVILLDPHFFNRQTPGY